MSQRSVTFAPQAWEDFNHWRENDSATEDKICELIKDIRREPFSGIGKPEPLKGNLKGYWSRRINEKDRLVYKVSLDSITIAYCKGHYADK
jgi:toxin YoeB